jgi:hypothetical protein
VSLINEFVFVSLFVLCHAFVVLGGDVIRSEFWTCLRVTQREPHEPHSNNAPARADICNPRTKQASARDASPRSKHSAGHACACVE